MNANLVLINPDCRITRIRTLPYPGKVIVTTGQLISTNDIIASIELPEKHLEINVATGLGVDPNRAASLIQVKPGDPVRKGDVLANRSGLLSKTVFSPGDGRVLDCSNARILIAVGSRPLTVQAGFSGQVKEVLPDLGAVLTTEGAILQGAWGNGRMAEGLLICLAGNRGELLAPDRMDISLRGSVVFGGPCLQAETLQRAAEIPLRGLVISGMAPELFPLADQMPFPVMVLIGPGAVPFDDFSLRIVQDLNKRVVCVNASAWGQRPGQRPEVIIPRHNEGPVSELPDTVDYQPGQLVRFLQSPYPWETARIKSLHPEAWAFASGITTPAALCVLENGKETVQALMNLEVIL